MSAGPEKVETPAACLGQRPTGVFGDESTAAPGDQVAVSLLAEDDWFCWAGLSVRVVEVRWQKRHMARLTIDVPGHGEKVVGYHRDEVVMRAAAVNQ